MIPGVSVQKKLRESVEALASNIDILHWDRIDEGLRWGGTFLPGIHLSRSSFWWRTAYSRNPASVVQHRKYRTETFAEWLRHKLISPEPR